MFILTKPPVMNKVPVPAETGGGGIGCYASAAVSDQPVIAACISFLLAADWRLAIFGLLPPR